MRVLEDLKIGSNHIEVLEILKTLPDRAKELLIATSYEIANRENRNFNDFWMMDISDYSKCESPIEKILYVAMDIVFFLREEETTEDFYIGTYPQFKINDKDKLYRVDFLLSVEYYKNSHMNSFDIIIECDGHEFHQKTKQQVKHDNEREMILKMLGYDVLRFSGTQIYENPIKCANDIFDYILTKIEK